MPVFAGMSRKELETIARNLDEVRVDAGTTVIHEGKSNQAFWIVVEGELDLTLRGRVLERISSPGLAGAPSMLDGRPAWATVTAVTPVRALVASTQQFRALRSDDPVAMRLWAATGARLRHHILESMSRGGLIAHSYAFVNGPRGCLAKRSSWDSSAVIVCRNMCSTPASILILDPALDLVDGPG